MAWHALLMRVSLPNALLRLVLGALLMGVGLVLALGAGVHAAAPFVIAVILGWVVLTAAIVMVGEALPVWNPTASALASFAVSSAMALGYAGVMSDSPFVVMMVALMAVIATASFGAGIVSFRRAREAVR